MQTHQASALLSNLRSLRGGRQLIQFVSFVLWQRDYCNFITGILFPVSRSR